MREHPVPQDITGYKFHIVGSMTIKQFAMVLGGVGLAFLVNLTNLPTFIKWPIMILLAAAGAGAAFVPIEEQPLDHWIVTFFKVLYKPTQYYWQREAKIPEAFLFEQKTKIDENDVPPDLSPAKKERIKEYLFSLDESAPDDFDLYEQNRIAALNQSFDHTPVALTKQPDVLIKETRFQASKIVSPHALTAKKQFPMAVAHENLVTKTKQNNYVVDSVVYTHPTEQTTDNSTVASPQDISTNKQLEVPQQEVLQVDTRTTPLADETESSNSIIIPSQPAIFSQTNAAQTTEQNTNEATYNAALPFPSKPTVPNKIAGMVLSKNNELINDAIIEIRNTAGQVMRAVKSNSLGQFFISTPLKNGNYLISAEKNGFEFTPGRLILEGKVLEPIEIKSS